LGGRSNWGRVMRAVKGLYRTQKKKGPSLGGKEGSGSSGESSGKRKVWRKNLAKLDNGSEGSGKCKGVGKDRAVEI